MIASKKIQTLLFMIFKNFTKENKNGSNIIGSLGSYGEGFTTAAFEKKYWNIQMRARALVLAATTPLCIVVRWEIG